MDPHVSRASVHAARGKNGRARARRPVPRTLPLRLADKRLQVLVSKKTPSETFVSLCRSLRSRDETALVATTDPQAWNVALQCRFQAKDERGAAEVLGLVATFARENASELVWTDLLFTVLRQRSVRMFRTDEIHDILVHLKRRYGAAFVARVLVEVVNGCANIKMLDDASELLLYQQSLWSDIRRSYEEGEDEALMPPSIVGHLMTKMVKSKQYHQVLEVARTYFAHDDFLAARDFQQQGFFALWHACVQTRHTSRDIVRTFLDYVDGKVYDSHGDAKTMQSLVLERGFGAAIQCCVTLEEYPLALECFSVMAHVRATFVGRTDSSNSLDDTWNEATPIVDDLLPVDENICVNVMKACMALTKFSTLKDVYRGMVARRVARSAGFGLAIRYCHKHLDARFLEEVLDGVFATEQALGGEWMLEVANYNDALGCFAATRRSRQAREVFAHMLQNPLIVPDHITMLEMVENHRDASIEDLFDLLDVFLARKLVPNVQVFTSLLSICMRRRVVGDALALIDAMKQQHVVLDVKVYTTIAFIHASQGDLLAVVQVVKEMTSHDVAVDDIFFDYVVNAVYGSCGLDMCYSLLREFSRQDLLIPEGLYRSLVALGIEVGVLERTLHVAYNMECDGWRLSSQQLHDLMMHCHSTNEIAAFVRTFSLLHEGELPPRPRFDVALYEDLISVLTRLNRKHDIPNVQAMAKRAGHSELVGRIESTTN